jgi:hypothetical protein
MVTPNALAGDQFYKVGDFVTFAWNYTSLSVTPSAIDVLASCSANQATYTIAVNVSAQETKVIWDTQNTPSGQAPFLTEKYTLLIYDAESSVTAAPRPGYLGVFNQFTFGMYTPQPYVNWTGKHLTRKTTSVPLTICRLPVRQLRKERRPLKLRKDDSESAPLHLWHNGCLPSLLRPQLRSVVVHKHPSRTIPTHDEWHSLYFTTVHITLLTPFERATGASHGKQVRMAWRRLTIISCSSKVRRWGKCWFKKAASARIYK